MDQASQETKQAGPVALEQTLQWQLMTVMINKSKTRMSVQSERYHKRSSDSPLTQ